MCLDFEKLKFNCGDIVLHTNYQIQKMKDSLLTQFMENFLDQKLNEENIKDFSLGYNIYNPYILYVSYKGKQIGILKFTTNAYKGSVSMELIPQ